MLALICVLLIPVSSFCEEGTSSEEERVLHLPGFYQDGMVLQSDRSVQIYGFSMSNQFQVNVKLSCDGSVEEYVIPGSKFKPKMLDNKDRFIWKVFLSEKSNGQECDLEFEQAREKIALSVVFGDVWLCSGQSNMKFPMGELMNATEELEASKSYHNIRMFKVHITFSSIPKYDITLSKINTWFNPMDQEKLTHFSALCFLYARYMTHELANPGEDRSKKVFGLIQSTRGGSRVEAWTPQYALESCGIDANVDSIDHVRSTSWLFNAMISPILMHTLYGVLWYQGESNAFKNREQYRCTFQALIKHWRKSGAQSGSDPNFPFGFVQLANFINGWKGVNIRWHQTFDKGYIDGTTDKLFMAMSMDTYDEPMRHHPRYKHIVARRLSIVGANVAYGIKSNPTNGPFPTDLTVQGRTSVIVHYKENITYNNQETSGFSVCCISYSECDEAWIVLEMTRGKMETSMTVTVNFEEVCGDNVPTGLAYLWEDTPTKRMFGLPIYSNDKFHLPGAPWKFELAQFMDN